MTETAQAMPQDNNAILWKPDSARIEASAMHAFRRDIERDKGIALPDYAALYDWSVENIEDFWNRVWDFCGVIGEKGDAILVDGDKMPGAAFFPESRLNFAENLLRRRDDGTAIIFRGEDKVERSLSHRQLYDAVSSLSQALAEMGVGPGDRVAGYMPNMPETIIAMLATAALGATWSSASPDFGVQGVIDRFGQVAPKVMVCADAYYYNGKSFSCLEKASEVLASMPSVEHLVVVPYVEERADISAIGNAVHYADLIAAHVPGDIDFRRMPFNHPLYIMFSSGTTGVPKCITHGAGGTLLQHLKEHRLQCDNGPDDNVFYFTTCGWMMWNWLVSALAVGSTLLLYDGSPFYPDGNVLFDYAVDHDMTFFGTSAKYIDTLKSQGLKPVETHDLSKVRSLASTGSPLVAESFDYVYEAIKPDLLLASIAGGTDIVSCFVLGNPLSPVLRGEIMGRGLGMAVDVFDDDGKPVRGEKGELVCTRPFPSMPVGFWGDDDGSRYRGAYFERFDNIWCHGDYVELTPAGGMIIYGRSDATLNPGGVRIGTAEIYRAVEQMDEVVESIAIGQDWDGDVRVVLFVILEKGVTLDEDLTARIRSTIRQKCTPRHMPARVVQVTDIPRTKSGKITEIAVRDVVHGRVIKNVEALANPAALEQYSNRAELKD